MIKATICAVSEQKRNQTWGSLLFNLDRRYSRTISVVLFIESLAFLKGLHSAIFRGFPKMVLRMRVSPDIAQGTMFYQGLNLTCTPTHLFPIRTQLNSKDSQPC